MPAAAAPISSQTERLPAATTTVSADTVLTDFPTATRRLDSRFGPTNFPNRRAGKNLDPQTAEGLGHHGGHVTVLPRQDMRRGLDDRASGAEDRENLGELHADRAAADEEQGLGGRG